ncbi:hypothetical protein L1987_63127 [Smallanthus sonchifolius]|uniref:Uncharacterized protein n=1 Tax=Smallanthus sonchifolius TaxID=185202 RepID=A0ACB9CCD6_9ASTR|nr:hypothetical protein L1987_63127 [Smallanthus sonchifolius]
MFEAYLMKKMKSCFHYRKDKTRSSVERSAPILKDETSLSISGDVSSKNRVIKSSGSANSPRGITELYEEKGGKLRVFTYAELRQATNDFTRLRKIGEGGFGCVYKGSIKVDDGSSDLVVVAVKKLNRDGFRGSQEALPWQRRLQIMLGAAQGLAYLHEELEAQVIFRDFKTSNILLDGDFNPKLSDFGLAREGPTEGNTHVSTAVIGRRSLERNRPREDQNLLDWVRRHPIDSKKFGIILDPRLEARYSLTDARKIAKLADSCLLKSAKDRPKMSQVVESLKQILQAPSEGSPSNKSFEKVEDESEELTESSNSTEVSESSKRRLAQLAKLSEHVGGFSKKGFMIMHRAKVS